MKSIEETHPSLKGKENQIDIGRDPIFKYTIDIEDVQKHTVDKQVLRELLLKGIKSSEEQRIKAIQIDGISATAHRGAMYAFESLLKELGLEEE